MPFYLAVFALCSLLGFPYGLDVHKFCLFFSISGKSQPSIRGGNWAASVLSGLGTEVIFVNSTHNTWTELDIWPYLGARDLGEKKEGFLTALSVHNEGLHFGNHSSHLPLWLFTEQGTSQANCLPSATRLWMCSHHSNALLSLLS